MNFLQKIIISGAMLQAYLRGWRTRYKIIVIESDDWGTIRTSSRRAYDDLAARGYAMEKSPLSADALETEEDLLRLYDVLESVNDRFGRPACLTANMILTNPDFEKIARNGFQTYIYETVDRTLVRTSERKEVVKRWNEGLSRRVFVPQLHGLEHVRWWEWMKALQAGIEEVHVAFKHEMCGLPGEVSPENFNFYGKYYLKDQEGEPPQKEMAEKIHESMLQFERLFGFLPLTTIAPGYCWYDDVELMWKDAGIEFIQSDIYQYYGNALQKRLHYTGEKSPSGPVYLVRNCQFEPAGCKIAGKKSCLERCLHQIALAFYFGKPAIISSHRYNFTGSIEPENRRRNLVLLEQLLRIIKQRWPDVLFLSSPELGFLFNYGDGEIEKISHDPGLSNSPLPAADSTKRVI